MDLVREVFGALNGLDALGSLLPYIFEVDEHVARDDLQRLLGREIGPQAKDVMMTIGQQLREEGRQQGIEQGRQQGIEQGRQRLREMLLNLLRQRFGTAVHPGVEQRIATASFEQIEVWTSRVLSAATLAELLGD